MTMAREDKQLGELAYNAYRDQAGGNSLISHEVLPDWRELPNEIQLCWITSALAVSAQVTIANRLK